MLYSIIYFILLNHLVTNPCSSSREFTSKLFYKGYPGLPELRDIIVLCFVSQHICAGAPCQKTYTYYRLQPAVVQES